MTIYHQSEFVKKEDNTGDLVYLYFNKRIFINSVPINVQINIVLIFCHSNFVKIYYGGLPVERWGIMNGKILGDDALIKLFPKVYEAGYRMYR